MIFAPWRHHDHRRDNTQFFAAEMWRLATEQPQLVSEPDSEGWLPMHWATLQLAHAQAKSSGSENERLRQQLHSQHAETARLADELRSKDAELLAMQEQLADRK